MEDIKLLEKCPNCNEHLTLMESIGMPDGNRCIVVRCTKCNIFIKEVAGIRSIPEKKVKEEYCPTCDNYERCVEDYKEDSSYCDYFIPKEGRHD